MKESSQLISDSQGTVLREGIKTKYRQYHLSNPVRFPDFPYNTNRANYEPLRASFEEEFYENRNLQRTDPNVHIPSTNTLALLFTDDSYTPGKKILNTCQSYAEGPSKLLAEPDLPVSFKQKAALPEKVRWLLLGGFAGIASLTTLLLTNRWLLTPTPSKLIISRPTPQSTVAQEVIVEGEVKNAESVWLVVRSSGGQRYWVQHPVHVSNEGWWIGVIFVGSHDKADEGIHYEVRAFVNPTSKLTTGTSLRNWPEAELSTEPLEVIRKQTSD